MLQSEEEYPSEVSLEILKPLRIEDCSSENLELPDTFTYSLRLLLQQLALKSPRFVNLTEENVKDSVYNRTNIFFLRAMMQAHPKLFKYLDIDIKTAAGYRLIDIRNIVAANTGLKNFRIVEADVPAEPLTILDCVLHPELLQPFLKPVLLHLLVALANESPSPIYIRNRVLEKPTRKGFPYLLQTVKQLKTEMEKYPQVFSRLEIVNQRKVGYILREKDLGD